MSCPNGAWDNIEKLMAELIDYQHQRVMKCGRQIIPGLTTDDILQPNDFPDLENHPVFRYEEGMLAGIQMVLTALRALEQDMS